MCPPLAPQILLSIRGRFPHAGAVVWKQGEKSDTFKHEYLGVGRGAVCSACVFVWALKLKRGIGGGVVSSSLEPDPVTPREKTTMDGWMAAEERDH